jgi:hypothetical protein
VCSPEQHEQTKQILSELHRLMELRFIQIEGTMQEIREEVETISHELLDIDQWGIPRASFEVTGGSLNFDSTAKSKPGGL